jgi:hypothetical protein
VPGRLAAFASFWQSVSAPAVPPKFALCSAAVRNTKLEALVGVAVGVAVSVGVGVGVSVAVAVAVSVAVAVAVSVAVAVAVVVSVAVAVEVGVAVAVAGFGCCCSRSMGGRWSCRRSCGCRFGSSRGRRRNYRTMARAGATAAAYQSTAFSLQINEIVEVTARIVEQRNFGQSRTR